MPGSLNPLLEMTEALGDIDSTQETPDESFVESALPGFKQALMARRSVREYDGEPMPETVMRDCLRDAILAPSSSNLQCYELYWIRDSARRAAVAEACLAQPVAMTAGELVVVVARGDLWRVHLDKMLEIMTHSGTRPLPGPLTEYYERIVPKLLQNDALGVNNLVRRLYYAYKGRQEASMRTPVNQGDHRIYGHVQATFAAQTLMLSLAAHGYDSCPIGGMDMRRIGKLLGLPRKAEVSLVIAAGRGKQEGIYGPRVRLPAEDILKEV